MAFRARMYCRYTYRSIDIWVRIHSYFDRHLGQDTFNKWISDRVWRLGDRARNVRPYGG
jgi:hypothetical protein